MIRRMSVRNFRCLREVDLECSGLLALVGPNGSGKSALLHALRFFFGKFDVDSEDCWGGDATLEVEVAVVIDVPEDDDAFAAFVREDGGMWVARRSAVVEGNRQSFWVARRRRNPDFEAVRSEDKAREAKKIYDELRDTAYQELPEWRNKEEALRHLDEWEREHPDRLEIVEDRSVGFGVRGGDLSRLLEPVFISAVHDAAAESEDARASHLRVLVERVVKPAEVFDQRAVEMDADLRRRYEEMIGEAGDALGNAARSISSRLERFAPGTEVLLEWEGRPPEIRTPGVRVRLVEGGHAAEVGRQGHGVQRAYILALLQALAEGAVTEGELTPLLVLMIEEPELYQHPSRSRILARILAELAAGEGARTQVVFATHSPEFVSLEHIESLRLFRLDTSSDIPSTGVSAVDLATVAQALWMANGCDEDLYTAETLRSRLRHLAMMPIAEGFFADGVILVEGEEDKAFVLGAVEEAGVDLDAHNVAVIPVGGKNNLDRPFLVFQQLGIPVYIVFDGDAHKSSDKNSRTNRRLLRLVEEEPVDEPETTVTPRWCCFRETFEKTIRTEVGERCWESALEEAATRAGFGSPSDAKKNPLVVRDAYRRVKEEGAVSEALQGIVASIRELFQINERVL